MSAATRYPSNLSTFQPVGHRSSEIPAEGAYVQPEPTPRVRYASRVPLQYDEEENEDDQYDEWLRSYGLLPGDGGCTVSAATGRRLSPIRAFGQHKHRRTASLDNIVDGIKETGSERSRQGEGESAEVPVAADVCNRSSRPSSSYWSPHRGFSSRPCDVNAKIGSSKGGGTPEDASGLKTKLKSISDKYLKNPVAGMMISGRDTLTSSLLNKIKQKHQSHKASGQGQHWEGERSSFRSFSCGTLPALDEFHRKKLLAAASSTGEVVPEELSESLEPSSPPGLRIEADSDSGIVPEWSDTSSISESSYIRHVQPCQLLSSWRKPQPKVRRSLSPIFQYKALQSPKDADDDEVDASNSSTAYETLWPASKDTSIEENDSSVMSKSEDEPSASVTVAVAAEEEPAPQLDAHTTRIHVEYPASPVMDPAAALPKHRSYQTASLDRRILAQEAKLKIATDEENGASVHLVKIERDPENLKAELGIFIAKKKLARGSVGYMVAHIVPGGLVDRYFSSFYQFDLELYQPLFFIIQ